MAEHQPLPVLLVDTGHEGYTVLTLNRPDRLNAFNPELLSRLHTALQDAAEDQACRAVLINAAGRHFCAGQDLSDRDPAKLSGPPDLGASLDQFYNPLVRQLRDLPKPVVCAVNGTAAGAGANIALACDLVVAGASGKFIQSFSALGLIPDAGGSWLLTRRLGEARAKGLAMTAKPLTAEQAFEWGLIWQVVPDDELVEASLALTAELASAATFGLGLTKLAIHKAGENTFNEHLDLERDLQQRAGRSKDYAEGVSAFLVKRKPVYSGAE